MRKFYTLWSLLKRHGTITITLQAKRHKEVIKGVSQEKWKDEGFKLMALEAGNEFTISPESSGDTLTLTLKNKGLGL